MGLGPFINASIIIQLLSQVVPQLETLQKKVEKLDVEKLTITLGF